jgi:hypothetical protein
MPRRIFAATLQCIAAMVLFVIAGVAFAQPTARPFIQSTDIDKEMAPCTELPAVAGGETTLPRKEIEACGGECEKVTSNIVGSVRTYFRTALLWRQVVSGAAAVVGGFALFAAVAWSERRRHIARRELFSILAGGAIVVAMAAMAVPLMIEREAAEALLIADHNLRGLVRLGLAGRSSVATNAHCYTQISTLLRFSDSDVWQQLAHYPGLFENFDANATFIPGDASAIEELKARIADMRKVLDDYLVSPQPLPTSVGGAFKTDEMLRKAAEGWDQLGFLRWRIVGGVVAAFGAVLVHYLCRLTFDAIARSRVRQVIHGATAH